MDNQAQTVQPTKPISDDQELAKVLAGITNEANKIEPSVAPGVEQTTPTELPAQPIQALTQMPDSINMTAPVFPQTPQPPQVMATANLDDIRKDALGELRPLVDRLDLAPEEKFDIYLLLLRSTDDTTLIAPAHQTAKNITDETKKAQALLDIIKEIDYLSKPDQP